MRTAALAPPTPHAPQRPTKRKAPAKASSSGDKRLDGIDGRLRGLETQITAVRALLERLLDIADPSRAREGVSKRARP